MKALSLIVVLAGLAACGVDGPPVSPSEAERTGLNVSGSVGIGIGARR